MFRACLYVRILLKLLLNLMHCRVNRGFAEQVKIGSGAHERANRDAPTAGCLSTSDFGSVAAFESGVCPARSLGEC